MTHFEKLKKIILILDKIKLSNVTWTLFNTKLKNKSRELGIEPIVFFNGKNPGTNFTKIRNGQTVQFKLFSVDDFLNVAEKISENLNLNDDSNRNINELVTLAFHSFPDTRLPYYFKYGLSNGLNLQFRNIPGWSSSINLFLNTEKKIEKNIIHLHTLSQALFLEKKLEEKIVFIPLFDFTGYGLMINKEHNLLTQHDSIDTLLSVGEEWKKILINGDFEIIVEINSDFHFMLIQYFKKYNFTKDELSLILDKIVSTETHKGKIIFQNSKKALLYCTNWVHFESLEHKDADKYHIIKGKYFYKHKNINGFIFLEDFYNKNINLIKKLYFNWLECLSILEDDFDKEKDNKSPYFIENSHIYNYCLNIENRFDLKITPLELKSKLTDYNDFYKNQKEIHNAISFIKDNDTKGTLSVSNNLTLAEINSQDLTFNPNELKELIKRSIEIIKTIQ